MYIISFDLGSTNNKVVVMKVENDNISLIGTKRDFVIDFNTYLHSIYNYFNILKEEVEVIVATGTGSSYIDDTYDNIKVIKVNEFEAIAYGGLILSKKENAIVVSIGTGTAIIKSDFKDTIYLGGTGLGGGTIVGLGKLLIGSIDSSSIDKSGDYFKKIITLSEDGDNKNVDLVIGDISKENIGNLTPDITAANFAAITKKPSSSDYAAAIINLVIENILLLVKSYNNEKLPVVIIGTLMRYDIIRKRINELADFMGNEYFYTDYPDYAIAIGAYEYYLLKIRVPSGR